MVDSFVDEYTPEPFSPAHVSHSQLDKWEMCPRQWEYIYIQGMKSPSNGNLILGGCYHETLEENFKKKLILGHDLDIDICEDFFSTVWDKEVADAWQIDWGKSDPDALKDMGIALIDKYIEEVAPLVIPQLVELWGNAKIGDVPFVIRIDLIDVNGVVIDHKTSAKSYNQADVDKDTQASACAFALGRPIVFQNHVAVKTKNPSIQILKTYRTREDVSWWYKKACSIVAHMKTGYAPPREDGWWCSPAYCGFWDLCRKDLARSYG